MNDEFQVPLETAPTDDLDAVEAFFPLLADANTRITLRFLTAHDRTTIDELAAVIVGSNAATTASVGSTDAYEQAKIHLHHSIVPRLEDHDLLAYDRATGEVTEATIPPAVAGMLDAGGDG